MEKFQRNGCKIEEDHDLNMFYAEYDRYVNFVKQGDEEFLALIEESAPKYRYALSEFLEKALVSLQPTMNESAMMESHGRALTMYRTICQENNEQPVV